MKQWYSMLSVAQKRWFYTTLFFIITVIALSVIIQPSETKLPLSNFSVDKTIRQTAKPLGVTGKSLARELNLPLSISKTTPLKELGINQKQLNHVVEHLLSHRDTMGKYFIFAALILAGLVFIIRLGKPDNASNETRKKWFPRLPYIFILVLAVLFCGFILGKSPNPMEGAVKLFKSMVGLYPDPAAKVIAFFFFIVLALIGNKIICGWACPFGALQELIYSIPVFQKTKKKKLPFWLTNTIRGTVFILMLLFMFAVLGGKKGFVLYHYVNGFNLFNLDFEYFSILLAVILPALLSFFTYRPYCTFVCPFGFISWLFERASFFGVRINYNACINCGACIKACPNQAAAGRVAKKAMPADCFSCMRCLNSCPVDAIKYKKPGN